MSSESVPASIHDKNLEQSPFKILKRLGHSKYSVYLINYPHSNEKFAMKLFPFENERPCVSFHREARFKNLRHPNVVSMIATQEKQKSSRKGKSFYSSYIIMELCPYGDFADMISKTNILRTDEKLLRTYFHQLIEGVEYLHSKGISHLDLKPDNLLLGENYVLKIGDFDRAYQSSDGLIMTNGSVNYRAPEIREGRCEDAQAADIYSLAIVLFCLKTGHYPFVENTKEGVLEFLLKNENPEFWLMHESCSDAEVHFSKDFKSLFLSMVKYDPVERATISEIKNSKWYCGPTYTQNELQQIMSTI